MSWTFTLKISSHCPAKLSILTGIQIHQRLKGAMGIIKTFILSLLVAVLFFLLASLLSYAGLDLLETKDYHISHHPRAIMDENEIQVYCTCVVKTIKDSFGFSGDIRIDTNIGAWVGERFMDVSSKENAASDHGYQTTVPGWPIGSLAGPWANFGP